MEITKQGSVLVIDIGGRKFTYPIGEFEMYYQHGDFIKIEEHIIRNYADVTEPASSSLDDLFDQLNTIINSETVVPPGPGFPFTFSFVLQ